MTETNYKVWETASLAEKYLTGVRGAVPMAKEQLDVILRLVKLNNKPVDTFLDLGSGDGVLSSVILSTNPEAKGVLLDISQHMMEEAKKKLCNFKDNLDFVIYDYSNKKWIERIIHKSFDVIISGLSIHHQTNERKKELYKEIFDLLNHGGIFINLEHVASPTEWAGLLFNECFIDSLFEMHRHKDPDITRQQIAEELYNRPDKEANILAPVEEQCAWLRKTGFRDVDCYFKLYELAIFGGRK